MSHQCRLRKLSGPIICRNLCEGLAFEVTIGWAYLPWHFIDEQQASECQPVCTRRGFDDYRIHIATILGRRLVSNDLAFALPRFDKVCSNAGLM